MVMWYYTFSSPEPLGLICVNSRPRDQETTGSGDENGYYRAMVRKKQVYFTKTCQRCLPRSTRFFCLLYVDEVHAIGWNQLITFYRKAVDIVKKITGRENETEAVSEFKTRWKSFSLCLNKQPFPLNESNNEAFKKCRTKRGGKYFRYYA